MGCDTGRSMQEHRPSDYGAALDGRLTFKGIRDMLGDQVQVLAIFPEPLGGRCTTNASFREIPAERFGVGIDDEKSEPGVKD